MVWTRVHDVLRTQRASSAFLEASLEAVSPQNKPGSELDVRGNAVAARAARALQDVLKEGKSSKICPGEDSIVSHKEELFEEVREHFGRSWEQYSCSLSEGALRLVGEEEAAGKSSAFFVFTEDGRYCLKSVAASEARSLLTIVEDYKNYVLSHETLLPRFYGLYEVQLMGEWQPVWLMVQGNVLGGRAGVVQRFDLKGSTHGRKASKKEVAKGQQSVLKDLDFVLNDCSLTCATPEGTKQWQVWVRSMESDAKWLASHGLIDYSLLLGFSTCSPDELRKPLSHVVRLEVERKSLGKLDIEIPSDHHLFVYAGIVDCLMPYNALKRIENLICDTLFSGAA